MDQTDHSGAIVFRVSVARRRQGHSFEIAQGKVRVTP